MGKKSLQPWVPAKDKKLEQDLTVKDLQWAEEILIGLTPTAAISFERIARKALGLPLDAIDWSLPPLHLPRETRYITKWIEVRGFVHRLPFLVPVRC